MDLRSAAAAQLYSGTRSKLAPDAGQGTLAQGLGSFAKTLQEGEDVARAALSGGADPQALVMALSQTEIAVETAVTLRDKVVEAYQEILRMPV